MKRYLEYHAGPEKRGWSRTKKDVSLNLALGIAVHEGLANILSAKGEVDKDIVARMAAANLREVLLAGDVPEPIIQEQTFLARCLILGWATHVLPKFLEQFELVSVEKEEELILLCTCDKYGRPSEEHDTVGCKGILFMSRPDFIARSKITGALSNHDFKTTSKLGEGWVDSWEDSLQMAIGSLAVEQRMGEEVREFYIHGLVKGGRGDFGHGLEQQYSIFCYANWTDRARDEFSGFWKDKSPVWKKYTAQQWIDRLPEEQLTKHFIMAGPYTRQDLMLQQFVRAMPQHEAWWGKTLGKLRKLEAKHGWSSDEFQKQLDIEIPRSYNCHKQYGSRCPVYEICMRHKGWEDPSTMGIYSVRVPHHLQEK